MSSTPSGGLSVMQNRRDPLDSLDFFPTPPWATRALVECVLQELGFGISGVSIWDPASGEGHIAKVLADYCADVTASDVHDYGGLDFVGSFVGVGADVAQWPHPHKPSWVITNPPFNLAESFLARALDEARGVAFLVRTSWLEGGERYRNVFSVRPPHIIAQFCERVPMVKGRWDPGASTATSYAWLVWRPGSFKGTTFMWIPPGQRKKLTHETDVARFATVMSRATLEEE